MCHQNNTLTHHLFQTVRLNNQTPRLPENMLIHLAAEESITNQKHQFIHYQDFVECSLFTLSVELQKNEKNNV